MYNKETEENLEKIIRYIAKNKNMSSQEIVKSLGYESDWQKIKAVESLLETLRDLYGENLQGLRSDY